MANSIDGQDHKDKYFDIANEVTLVTINMHRKFQLTTKATSAIWNLSVYGDMILLHFHGIAIKTQVTVKARGPLVCIKCKQ